MKRKLAQWKGVPLLVPQFDSISECKDISAVCQEGRLKRTKARCTVTREDIIGGQIADEMPLRDTKMGKRSPLQVPRTGNTSVWNKNKLAQEE